MAKFLTLAVCAALLMTKTLAHEGHSESSNTTVTKECAANVTAAAIAAIDNSTYLNTCAPGSTWNLTSVFEAANLSTTDFAKFCNATACMNGLHELLNTLPDDCLSNYHGSEVVLADKVDAVHDKCHMEEDSETSSSQSEEAGSKSSSSKSSSTVTTPAPTTSSALTAAPFSSKSLAALISVAATVAAFAL